MPWPARGCAPAVTDSILERWRGLGTVKHGSRELPVMVKTTVTFTFPAKGSSQAAVLAAAGLGAT